MEKCHITNILTNKINNYWQRVGAGLVLAILCAMVGAVFGVHDTFATASTLSLTVDNSTVDVNLIANSAAGSFAKSSNTTITAATNNITGYTLSVAASSSTNYDRLINSDNTACNNTGESSYSNTGTVSSNCFTSIKDPTPESAFKALAGTGYNNLWGYLPSKYCTGGTCTTNTDFRPAPKASGDIIDKTDAANTTPNEYALAIGARVDSSVKMGSYSNTYNVILVGNEIPYSITYDDNVVSNMPTDTSGASSNNSVNIDTKVPVRSGYEFLGWCTVQPTNNNGTDVCTGGTTYAAGDPYTLNQTGTNNLSLIAMWGELSMQSFGTSDCSAMSAGATMTLKDTRDGTEYTIGKFDDGKCWMLDNLALDLYDSNILNSLSSDNTNIDQANEANILASLKNSGGNRSAGNQYSTAGLTAWTSSYSYSVPMASLGSKDIVPQGNSDPLKAETLAGNWKVGGYYNYCAVSAGSYCYGNGTSAGTSSGNVTSSICPKGWRLPTSNTGGEFATLYGLYNNYTNFRNAFHLPLSGYFYNGSAYPQGSNGSWWSSTRLNGNYMYSLDANTSDINPSGFINRYNGYSVRCVMGS